MRFRTVGRRSGWTAMGLAALAATSALVAPASAQVRDTASSDWADQNGIDDYAWIDRADTLSETLGETPPDYSFDFDGQRPWAWSLDDGSLVIVEQRQDGPYSYYFDPGHDDPFLVRGPEMSYAFMLGRVAVMYDAEGGVLSHADGDAYLDQAIDDYERGRDLQQAWQRRGGGEQPVEMSMWLDFWPLLSDWNYQWDTGRRLHTGWRARHVMRDSLEYRMRLARERQRREQLAERFRNWREHGWQGTPPGRWHRPPSGWQPRPRPDRPGTPGRPGRPGDWHGPGSGGGRPVTGGPARPPRPDLPGSRPPRSDRPGEGGVGTSPRPPRPDGDGRPDRPHRPGGWTRPAPTPPVTSPGLPAPDTASPRPIPGKGFDRPVRPAEMPRPVATPRPSPVTTPQPAERPARIFGAPRTPQPAYTPPAAAAPSRPAYTPSAPSRPSYSPPARSAPAPRAPAPRSQPSSDSPRSGSHHKDD